MGFDRMEHAMERTIPTGLSADAELPTLRNPAVAEAGHDIAQPQSRRGGVEVSAGIRRASFVVPVAIISLVGALLAFMSNGGVSGGWEGGVLTLLETVNLTLLMLASWSWFVGAGVSVFEKFVAPIREMNPPEVTGHARTAILMPICDEDPARVFRALEIMRESVLWTAVGDIDTFVLSDSRDESIANAESAAHASLLARIADEGDSGEGMSRAVHYRRRLGGVGRKAGNVQDFCERWGAAYDYMIVLDADSMMSGRAIAHLIGRMNANPRVGIIQAMCYAAGKNTLFARMQQWGGRMGGPVLSRGLAFWQGGAASWWGHNAIIRVAAFAEHCGLPHLPGAAPLGGEILCHDIVEAAMMVRAGWEVRLDHQVGGSWEESPTNMVDSLARERRWCQGNMQHARIAASAHGLAPTSRLHLAMGALHYAGSFPFFLLVLADCLMPHRAQGNAGAQAALLVIVAVAILLPRLTALAILCCRGDETRWWAGTPALAGGWLAEIVLGTLMAPVSMVFNTVFVMCPLLGRAVGWNAQQRGDRKPGWMETWRTIGMPLLLCGVIAVALSFWGGSSWVAMTMAPGLLLAVPLAVWTGCPLLGSRARRAGLFVTPEELGPPRELLALGQPSALVTAEPVPYMLPVNRGLSMPPRSLVTG